MKMEDQLTFTLNETARVHPLHELCVEMLGTSIKTFDGKERELSMHVYLATVLGPYILPIRQERDPETRQLMAEMLVSDIESITKKLALVAVSM